MAVRRRVGIAGVGPAVGAVEGDDPEEVLGDIGLADQRRGAGCRHGVVPGGYAILAGVSAPCANPARTVRPRARRIQMAGGLGARGRLPRRADLARRRAARRCPSARRRTCWRCCRTRPVRSTSATSRTTRWATSWRTSGAATALRCSTPWGTTPSACRPRTPRSAPASPRRRSSRRTSRASASRCGAWASSVDWRHRDRHQRPRRTTAGPSGSSCACSSAAWPSAARRR